VAPRNPICDFSRLADALIDDLLAQPDEEIVAEAEQAGDDIQLIVAQVDSEIAAATATAGKRRLEAARAQLDSLRSLRRKPSLTGLPRASKEQILRRFAANDNPLQKRLTMAARNGEGLTEDEVDTILLDLLELGALDEQGNMK
jgi:hypothetical protein